MLTQPSLKNVSTWSKKDYAQATASLVASMTPQQVAEMLHPDWLNASAVASLTASQVSAISVNYSELSAAWFNSLSDSAISGLTALQLSEIPGEIYQKINARFFSQLSVSQVSQLCASLFSNAVGGKVPLENLLSAAQWAAVTTTTLSQLSNNAVSSLSASAIAKLSDAQIQALNVSSLTSKQQEFVDAAGHTVLSELTSSQLQQLKSTVDPTPIKGDKLVATSGPLFSTSTSSSPMGAVVSQGYYDGDCWLVAAIAATASIDPDLIKSMISENANGTYNVRFYNVDNNTSGVVTVDNQLPTFTGVQDSDGTLWGALIEKAYIVAQSLGIATPKAGLGADSYSQNQGGGDEGLTAITGMHVTDLGISNNALTQYGKGGSYYNEIYNAFSAKETVIFGSNTNTSFGLVGGHMFEVIGIDSATSDYIFQNPWGPNAGCKPFEVSASELSQLIGSGDNFEVGDVAGPGASNYAKQTTASLVQAMATASSSASLAATASTQSLVSGLVSTSQLVASHA